MATIFINIGCSNCGQPYLHTTKVEDVYKCKNCKREFIIEQKENNTRGY